MTSSARAARTTRCALKLLPHWLAWLVTLTSAAPAQELPETGLYTIRNMWECPREVRCEKHLSFSGRTARLYPKFNTVDLVPWRLERLPGQVDHYTISSLWRCPDDRRCYDELSSRGSAVELHPRNEVEPATWRIVPVPGSPGQFHIRSLADCPGGPQCDRHLSFFGNTVQLYPGNNTSDLVPWQITPAAPPQSPQSLTSGEPRTEACPRGLWLDHPTEEAYTGVYRALGDLIDGKPAFSHVTLAPPDGGLPATTYLRWDRMGTGEEAWVLRGALDRTTWDRDIASAYGSFANPRPDPWSANWTNSVRVRCRSTDPYALQIWDRSASMEESRTEGFEATLDALAPDDERKLVVRRGTTIELRDPGAFFSGDGSPGLQVRNLTAALGSRHDWPARDGGIYIPDDAAIGVYEVTRPSALAGDQIVVLFNPYAPGSKEHFDVDSETRSLTDQDRDDRIRQDLDEMILNQIESELRRDNSTWSDAKTVLEARRTLDQYTRAELLQRRQAAFLALSPEELARRRAEKPAELRQELFDFWVHSEDSGDVRVTGAGKATYNYRPLGLYSPAVFEATLALLRTAAVERLHPLRFLSDPWSVLRAFTWLLHDKQPANMGSRPPGSGVARAQWDAGRRCPYGSDDRRCQGMTYRLPRCWFGRWNQTDDTVWTANCEDMASMYCATSRLLGVACRVVAADGTGQGELPTDFVHDVPSFGRTNLDEAGNRTEVVRTSGNNALWGYHVWTEVYLGSSDLSPTPEWYVSDPSPGAESDCRVQAGPIPLSRIRENDTVVENNEALSREIEYFTAKFNGFTWVRRGLVGDEDSSLSFQAWKEADFEPASHACFLDPCHVMPSGTEQFTSLEDSAYQGHIWTLRPGCRRCEVTGGCYPFVWPYRPDRCSRGYRALDPLISTSWFYDEPGRNREPNIAHECVLTTTSLYKSSFGQTPFTGLDEDQLPGFARLYREQGCLCGNDSVRFEALTVPPGGFCLSRRSEGFGLSVCGTEPGADLKLHAPGWLCAAVDGRCVSASPTSDWSSHVLQALPPDQLPEDIRFSSWLYDAESQKVRAKYRPDKCLSINSDNEAIVLDCSDRELTTWNQTSAP